MTCRGNEAQLAITYHCRILQCRDLCAHISLPGPAQQPTSGSTVHVLEHHALKDKLQHRLPPERVRQNRAPPQKLPHTSCPAPDTASSDKGNTISSFLRRWWRGYAQGTGMAIAAPRLRGVGCSHSAPKRTLRRA